jgi:hypothetical protein
MHEPDGDMDEWSARISRNYYAFGPAAANLAGEYWLGGIGGYG